MKITKETLKKIIGIIISEELNKKPKRRLFENPTQFGQIPSDVGFSNSNTSKPDIVVSSTENGNVKLTIHTIRAAKQVGKKFSGAKKENLLSKEAANKLIVWLNKSGLVIKDSRTK